MEGVEVKLVIVYLISVASIMIIIRPWTVSVEKRLRVLESRKEKDEK